MEKEEPFIDNAGITEVEVACSDQENGERVNSIKQGTYRAFSDQFASKKTIWNKNYLLFMHDF